MAPSTSKAFLGLLASTAPASAFFLIPCWPVTTQRLDPIVNPGDMSSHLHQVVGGNGFAPAMDYNTTQEAECTTCFVSKDKSNYWIPALYYQDSDGSFERVSQVGSTSVYYFNEKSRLGQGEELHPFPTGLRMLAGDPTKRADDSDFATQALNYKCLNYQGTPTDHRGFPDVNCPDGVRAEVTFPSCWDGKNLDSDDHKSHMAYPTLNFENGACPSSHPVHVVTMKVEFIFDTNVYKDKWTNGKNPFVWSDGDPTGFGLHADYMMGWDSTVLDAAVEQCLDPNGVLANCPPFDGLLPAQKDSYVNPGTCVVKDYVDEDIGAVGSVIAKLPGCNQLTWGPGPALKQTCQSAAKLIGDWSSAAQQAGSQVNEAIKNVVPGQFFQQASDASSSSSAAPAPAATTSSTEAAAPTTTTTTTMTTTTTPPPPPPPAPTTTQQAHPNVVIVTDIVYETFTETVEAMATALAGHKRHAHQQHMHRHNRRGQAHAQGHF